MVTRLPNGAVIPDGLDRIPANGNEPTRVLGASLDAQLGIKADTTYVDGVAATKADTTYVDQTVDGMGRSINSRVAGINAQLDEKADAAAVDARLDGISSAYDVWVAAGNVGTVDDYLASIKGDQGVEGPFGGTVVTDPQVASYVVADTETRAVLEARYRRSVSVREYGAEGDGTTDDTLAVQDALTQNPGASVYFPPGTYRLTGNLSIPAGTAISGADSASTLLDWSTKPEFTTEAFLAWAPGTVEAPHYLTADARFADVTLAVTDGHDFQVGDYIRLTSDETMWAQAVKGEIQRVLEVEGNTLHLSAPVFDDYLIPFGARVQRMNLTTGSIHGLSIRGKGINPGAYGDNAVHAVFAQDFHVSDVRFTDVEHRCVILDTVLGATVHNTHFRFDTSRTPLQYGVSVSGASQMVTISDCSSWNDRHLFTTNHSAMLAENRSESRGIPRIIAITGCTAHGSWQAPIDTHRGGEYITIVGNALTSESTGIKVRSRRVLVVGNVITGKRISVGGAPSGIRVSAYGGDVQITGNSVHGFEQGIWVDTPDADAGTRSISISENTVLDCTYPIHFRASTLISQVRVSGNMLRATETGHPVQVFAPVEDIDISGNIMQGGNTGIYCVSMSYGIDRGTIQDNVFRGQSSRAMYLLNFSDGYVSGNYAPGMEIRFHGTGTGTRAVLNQGNVVDTSTPGIDYPNIDHVFAPVWLPVTITSAHAAASGGYPPQYSLTGKTVRLRGRVEKVNGDPFTSTPSYAVSVPVAGRPPNGVSGTSGAAGGAVASLDIATNGVTNISVTSPADWVSLDGVTYDLA